MIIGAGFGRTGTTSLELALELHNREVSRAIPAERLLVYDVADGWAPLCASLGVPEPAEPFPKANTADELTGRLPS